MPSSTNFNHETVSLDGEHFSDCEWKFEGPAEQTLAHLKAVWNAGGKAPVQALIKEITGGGGR